MWHHHIVGWAMDQKQWNKLKAPHRMDGKIFIACKQPPRPVHKPMRSHACYFVVYTMAERWAGRLSDHGDKACLFGLVCRIDCKLPTQLCTQNTILAGQYFCDCSQIESLKLRSQLPFLDLAFLATYRNHNNQTQKRWIHLASQTVFLAVNEILRSLPWKWRTVPIGFESIDSPFIADIKYSCNSAPSVLVILHC